MKVKERFIRRRRWRWWRRRKKEEEEEREEKTLENLFQLKNYV